MSVQAEAKTGRPGEVFSPRTLLAIIAIGTAAFVGMIYLEMFGIDDPDFEIGPSTLSWNIAVPGPGGILNRTTELRPEGASVRFRQVPSYL